MRLMLNVENQNDFLKNLKKVKKDVDKDDDMR